MTDDLTKPTIEAGGVPFCSYEECPSYDGKRCVQIGQRPHGVCEPAVTLILTERDALRAEVARLKTEMEAMRAVVEAAEKWRLWDADALDGTGHDVWEAFCAAVDVYRRTRPSGEGEP